VLLSIRERGTGTLEQVPPFSLRLWLPSLLGPLGVLRIFENVAGKLVAELCLQEKGEVSEKQKWSRLSNKMRRQ
jgi:hypothetical protein